MIGVLAAVTLILLGLFLIILAYSRRQKLQSPTNLNPFPAVQINMKELLTASPMLSGENSGQSPNPIAMSEFEECRSKWHSTGHMDFAPIPYRTSTSHITQNPLCSEYASVDIQTIGPYRSLQGPVPPTSAPPSAASSSGTYNLGHFFPRVSSEPPSRKSYQSANRSGDPLKVSFPFFV